MSPESIIMEAALNDNRKPPAQVGGKHYQTPLQPIEYIEANRLGFHEANVVKYITRYKAKNGREDLLKAKWYLDRLIEIYKD